MGNQPSSSDTAPPREVENKSNPPREVEDKSNDEKDQEGKHYQVLTAYLSCLPETQPPIGSSPYSPIVIAVTGFILYVVAVTCPVVILVFTMILSVIIPRMYWKNDSVEERRKAYKKWMQNDAPMAMRETPSDLVIEEKYWENERGMQMMTVTTMPKDKEIKGVICFCHGYCDSASHMKRFELRAFASAGYACIAMEYEGHGRSDGTISLINDLSLTVNDARDFFEHKLSSTPMFQGKKVFLMGESLGGAVAYLCYNLSPNLFSGVVFISPMLKISDEMKPPQIVTDILLACIGEPGTESLLGNLPVAPTADINNLIFKEPQVTNFAMNHPLTFRRNPRLATSRELLVSIEWRT